MGGIQDPTVLYNLTCTDNLKTLALYSSFLNPKKNFRKLVKM